MRDNIELGDGNWHDYLIKTGYDGRVCLGCEYTRS